MRQEMTRNVNDCIAEGVSEGWLNPDDADYLRKRYKSLMGQLFSRKKAAETLADELRAEAAHQQRIADLINKFRVSINEEIFSYTDEKGVQNPFKGLMSKIEHLGTGQMNDFQHRYKALLVRANVHLAETIWEVKGKHWLTGDAARFREGETKDLVDSIIRELHGESTGNAEAKKFAAAWRDLAEMMRQEFNAAGGSIKLRDDWGSPQSHNREAIIEAGEKAWVDYMMTPGVLNRDRMVNPHSGVKLGDEDLRDMLSHIYASITTNGWAHREATSRPKGYDIIHGRHNDQRYLVFNDADAWVKYQAKFGENDLFGSLMSHINTMSRDIAMMETFGPDPRAMLHYFDNVLQEYAETNHSMPGIKNLREYKSSWMRSTWLMYDMAMGEHSTPVSKGFADFNQALRNLMVATKLGSAGISALSDPAFGQMARQIAGMPMAEKYVMGSIRPFQKLGKEGIKQGVRTGQILDIGMHVAAREMRHAMATQFRGVTGYLADRMMQYNFLGPYTQAGKIAFGLEFSDWIAGHIHHNWNDLPEPMRNFFSLGHNFSEADWNKIRKVKVAEFQGDKYFDPRDLFAVDREVALKYYAMQQRLLKYAVPEPTLRAKAAMLGETKAGTFLGEAWRHMLLFKGFSVSLNFVHGAEVARRYHKDGFMTAFGMAAAMIVHMTILGAISAQLKELTKGRDPKDMSNGKFWGAAFLQGGGVGIYGDLLFSEVSRSAYGAAMTAMGPVYGSLGGPLANLTVGNILEGVSSDKDTNAGRELTRFIRENTPLIATHFMTRMIFDRMIMDQFQYYVDPKAHESFNRQMQWYRRDHGQEAWWPSGQPAPLRPPDPGAAVRNFETLPNRISPFKTSEAQGLPTPAVPVAQAPATPQAVASAAPVTTVAEAPQGVQNVPRRNRTGGRNRIG